MDEVLSRWTRIRRRVTGAFAIGFLLILVSLVQFVVRYQLSNGWDCQVTSRGLSERRRSLDPAERRMASQLKLGAHYDGEDGCLVGDRCWYTQVDFFSQERSTC